MIFIVMCFAVQLLAFDVQAKEPEFCENDLTRVDPMAADPYDRLGVPEGIQSTQLTGRFRAVVAQFKDNPSDLSRLASAYAQIRLDHASGVQFEASEFKVATLRRAHGRIYGDPLGGRFTVGYTINRAGLPDMDYSLMMREVLRAPAAEAELLKLPVEYRPYFEIILKYFGQQIRRVGLEGGFEDVFHVNWTAAHDIPPEALRPTMKLFVKIFGRVYREAQADPGGIEEKAARKVARGLRFPPEIERPSLAEQLAFERDPRTFLRKVVTYLRQKPARQEHRLEIIAEMYARHFLVEPAQFLQHLLLFATDQWTSMKWDVREKRRDHAPLRMITGLLRQIWIDRFAAAGEAPRLFDYASVLYDANRIITGEPFEVKQAHSPLWVELSALFRAHPEIRRQLEVERGARAMPSDMLPW